MTSNNSVFELRVQGHLDKHWAGWLGDLAINHEHDGTSTLTGPVDDQAQLHGLLAAIRDIGAPLLSLRGIDTRDQATPEPTLVKPEHTERLTLRPATPEDADATWRYRRLPEVGEWLTEIPTDLTAYQAAFAEPRRLANTVIVECNGEIVGDFMLRVEDAWAQTEIADQARRTQAELGWVLDPAFRGRGYATEAVRALLKVSFEGIGVRRIVASCFLDNDASWRLMERVGMRREVHAVAEALHRDGRWLDTVAYAVLAEEWRQRR